MRQKSRFVEVQVVREHIAAIKAFFVLEVPADATNEEVRQLKVDCLMNLPWRMAITPGDGVPEDLGVTKESRLSIVLVADPQVGTDSADVVAVRDDNGDLVIALP